MSDELIATMHTVCGDGKITVWTVDHLIESPIGVFDKLGAKLPYTVDAINSDYIVHPPIPYGLEVYLWYTFK